MYTWKNELHGTLKKKSKQVKKIKSIFINLFPKVGGAKFRNGAQESECIERTGCPI